MDGLRELRRGTVPSERRNVLINAAICFSSPGLGLCTVPPFLPPQGGTAITADLTQNERAVHVDFFNGTSEYWAECRHNYIYKGYI